MSATATTSNIDGGHNTDIGTAARRHGGTAAQRHSITQSLTTMRMISVVVLINCLRSRLVRVEPPIMRETSRVAIFISTHSS